MPAPTPSNLDFGQVLQGSFDEANGRLRVEGQATVVDGALEVSINATDDNIAVKDPSSGNVLKVNSDGSINVEGTITSSNPSIGTTGSTAPTSATEIGGVDSSGNLKALSIDSSGNVKVTGTSTVTGTVTTNQAGLNSFQTSQYTIGVTPVQLAPTPLTNRSSISLTVIATANVAVYIGNSSSVSVANGYPLYNGSTIQLDLTPSGNIWGVTATAGQTIAVLEIA